MGVKERIAYLRGLFDGSGFCADDPQAKSAWDSLLAICSDLAEKVEMLEAGQAETDEYLEAIDSDLADLEDALSVLTMICDSDIVEMICPNDERSLRRT